MKLGSEKFKERSRNIFCEDVNNLVRRSRREALSWPSKIVEGSSLNDDAALALARMSNLRCKMGKPRERRRIERERVRW